MDSLEWVPILRAFAIFATSEGFAASCTSVCLLGISLSKTFSVIFCILLILFAATFGFLAYRTSDDNFLRIGCIVGSVLMLVSAIFCILVDEDFLKDINYGAKVPLYMFIASSILINFSIDIIQLVRIMPCGDMSNRLLNNSKMLGIFFGLNVVLGFLLGIVFGASDVEDHLKNSTRMTVVTVIFLFVGILFGAAFAFFNEYQTQRLSGVHLQPLGFPQVTEYDKM